MKCSGGPHMDGQHWDIKGPALGGQGGPIRSREPTPGSQGGSHQVKWSHIHSRGPILGQGGPHEVKGSRGPHWEVKRAHTGPREHTSGSQDGPHQIKGSHRVKGPTLGSQGRPTSDQEGLIRLRGCVSGGQLVLHYVKWACNRR